VNNKGKWCYIKVKIDHYYENVYIFNTERIFEDSSFSHYKRIDGVFVRFDTPNTKHKICKINLNVYDVTIYNTKMEMMLSHFGEFV